MRLSVPTLSPSGTTSVFGNFGEMGNKGIEFTLNTDECFYQGLEMDNQY